MESEKQSLKEEFLEVFYLIKACLESFWFWTPIFFATFLYLQLLAFFFIHPLTILVTPAILSIYVLWEERKRFKTRYETSSKVLLASDPLGSKPHSPTFKFDAEEAVRNYLDYMKRKNKKSSS